MLVGKHKNRIFKCFINDLGYEIIGLCREMQRFLGEIKGLEFQI